MKEEQMQLPEEEEEAEGGFANFVNTMMNGLK